MKFLLDTCFISEFTKRKPNPKVLAWLEAQDETSLFVPSIVMGEIKKGICLLPQSKKKDSLIAWFKDIEAQFSDRIIGFDLCAALIWGNLLAEKQKEGHIVPVIDAQIASIARASHCILISRNLADFINLGVKVLNVWE